MASFKPGVGQNAALHALPVVGNFLLALICLSQHDSLNIKQHAYEDASFYVYKVQ